MALAKKCDRCGKLYEHYPTNDINACNAVQINDDRSAEVSNLEWFEHLITHLNRDRKRFIETKDKQYWWQMIQLLPSSYNQKRTVMLNYEVLANIYKSRCNHKLDEWRELCTWIESLPYSELITGVLGGTDNN